MFESRRRTKGLGWSDHAPCARAVDPSLDIEVRIGELRGVERHRACEPGPGYRTRGLPLRPRASKLFLLEPVDSLAIDFSWHGSLLVEFVPQGSATCAGEMNVLAPYRAVIPAVATAEGRFRVVPRAARSPISGSAVHVPSSCRSERRPVITNRRRAAWSLRPLDDARVESSSTSRRHVVVHTTADRTEGEAETTQTPDDAVQVPAQSSGRRKDVIVDQVLASIEGTDSGRKMSQTQRDATDADLCELESIGKTQTPNSLDDPRIFGDYDVTYVSTGGKQIGNPAGGRFRGGLGAFLFRTIGLEQNLYEPNVVVNRVAFLIFGLIPGQVVLNGTFAALTAELAEKNEKGEVNPYGIDDGQTVRAFFDPPRITLGGLPSFGIGPKSSVVLSTTYLDERVRLGRGSRGSLFVFTRKSSERAARDRRRWSVGGLGVTMMLVCTAALLAFAVRRFRQGGVTELSVATAVAVAVSFAMALVMRQGGIVAEDADYDEAYEKTVEANKAVAKAAQETKEDK